MSDETRSPCERCGLTKVLKTYKPNLGKHPGKVAKVCSDCAATDNKLIAIEEPVDVPAISPAVPVDKTEDVPVKKFEAVPPEPIQIATPKSAPKPEPEPCSPPAPMCTEPISREEVRAKLAKEESDLNSVLESRQRLLAQAQKINSQLEQVNQVIAVKKGSVAMTRDILGDKG